MSWILLSVFAAPTILIMISWNTLPGNPLYGVKLGLEKILLFSATPSEEAQASLNVRYTQFRLNEARILLAQKQSGDGLSYLTHQIEATRVSIRNTSDTGKRKELAQRYILDLQVASRALSEDRDQITRVTAQQTVSSVPTPTNQPVTSVLRTLTPTPTGIRYATITPADSVNLPTATPTHTPLAPGVEEELEEAQEEIEEAIEELEQFATQSADTPQEPTPTMIPEPASVFIPAAAQEQEEEKNEKKTEKPEFQVPDNHPGGPGSETE